MANSKTTKKANTAKRDDDFGGFMLDKNPALKKKLDKIKADAKKEARNKK